ncbi:SMI1/KNR4 family protein [Catellatospora methionotrophica]|uniref:SMI1/KNR4 family protein n=1 Tax=Catellatospora methionotrophica TaxID=121620 RepID=UPI001943587F|nr:SMI1/KNR4 family protein [Catellatospora methionotrophica]
MLECLMPFSSTLAAIDGWLAEHAPLTLRDLPAPATAADLAAVRAHLGTDLLKEVEQLLRWHNGAGRAVPPFCLAPGYAFLSTADMIATSRRHLAEDAARHWHTWNRQWLPVAAGQRGRVLTVDHAESDTHGHVTISSTDDSRDFPKTWPDLDALLSRTYEAMRYGNRFMKSRRTVLDGRLDWDEA